MSLFGCETLNPRIDKVLYKKCIFPFKLFTTVTRKDNVIMKTAAGKADTRVALITINDHCVWEYPG